MKTSLRISLRASAALLLLTVGLIGLAVLPADAQIRQMSKRKLHAETNRAERQAHRAARKVRKEDPTTGAFLDMSVYDMKRGAVGHKSVKATDGRDNYQFTKAGQPMVTAAPTLTAKRLKRKK